VETADLRCDGSEFAVTTYVRDVPVTTDEVLEDVLHAHPDVRGPLGDAWDAAWDSVDPVLLELCRLRIAMLLGCRAELVARTSAAVEAGLDESVVAVLADWPRSARFGPRERAGLAFTEQFVIDVAGIDDATVGRARAELGDQGLADFVSALLVVEQRQRLRSTWERLFGADDG
jgi:alkylhydroperoxidase family enzyme